MQLFIFTVNIIISSLLFAQSTELWASTQSTPSKQQDRLEKNSDVWERIRSGIEISEIQFVATKRYKALPNDRSSQPQLDHVQSLNNDAPNFTNDNSSNVLTSRTSNLHTPTNSGRRLVFPITAAAPMYRYTSYGRLKHNVLQTKNTAPQMNLDSIKIEPNANLNAKPIINNALPQTPNKDSTTNQHGDKISQYDRIHKHVDWYNQHSDYLHQVTERARPYLYHIVESLNHHDLPYDLALLPIIESAYQATALSPKSAAGLWQFIPGTGHDFDLHQSKHYDGRLDITASTLAAIRYLTLLNQHFRGDWLLTLAAYNCGQGTVDNAVNRNLAKGMAVDFWSLHLPEETREYVPRFLALSSIFANPDAYGLKLNQLKNEPYFVTVKIDRKHDVDYLAEKEFKDVAQLADLSYEEFSRLNPGYISSKLPMKGPFSFIMPAINANQLHQRLTGIAQFLNKPIMLLANDTFFKKEIMPTTNKQKIHHL